MFRELIVYLNQDPKVIVERLGGPWMEGSGDD
jgi:hypothetical protein